MKTHFKLFVMLIAIMVMTVVFNGCYFAAVSSGRPGDLLKQAFGLNDQGQPIHLVIGGHEMYALDGFSQVGEFAARFQPPTIEHNYCDSIVTEYLGRTFTTFPPNHAFKIVQRDGSAGILTAVAYYSVYSNKLTSHGTLVPIKAGPSYIVTAKWDIQILPSETYHHAYRRK